MDPLLYAGVDLGGTTVGYVIAKRDGTILWEHSAPTNSHEGPRSVLDRIASALLGAGLGPIAAVGVGIPGLIDLEHGIVRFCPNMPTNWRNVEAAHLLRDRLGCPIALLNDARLATLGELRFGREQSARTLVFLTLGTGIGGGVAIGGKLHLGPLGAAGELGHQTIFPDGPLCGCGNRGCLESMASGPAISAEGVRLLRSGLAPKLHEIVQGDAERVTPATMALAAAQNDSSVRDAILRAARYLGIGIANVVTTLHPDTIVLGGGVAGIGPMLFDAIREEVRHRVRMFPPDDVRIEPSTLGTRAGLYGGIALAIETLEREQQSQEAYGIHV